jgi:hypothetical protein
MTNKLMINNVEEYSMYRIDTYIPMPKRIIEELFHKHNCHNSTIKRKVGENKN